MAFTYRLRSNGQSRDTTERTDLDGLGRIGQVA
jgi:hypothetical protein